RQAAAADQEARAAGVEEGVEGRRVRLHLGPGGSGGFRAHRPIRSGTAMARCAWVLAPKEVGELFGVGEVQVAGKPFPGRLVEKRRSDVPLGTRRWVAPDEAVVFVGEPLAVPLADAADRVAERGADGLDGLDRGGVAGHGFGVDAD